MTKETLFAHVDEQQQALLSMADDIFDHPELGFQEVHAQKLLTDYLRSCGFQVDLGTGGVETAFRAEFSCGQGGPRIGLLCEYDALEGLGHACGHHMQGPAIVGAAKALKEWGETSGSPFSVVVYGTPAEETAHGKLRMLEQGCFQDIDVALMMHGSPTTTVDVKSMALSSFVVTFHGKKAHAALKPEEGRSALDALLTAFNGIEFLREHVPEDTRMHYTILQSPGPANVVPDTAMGKFMLRSYSRKSLDHVVERFKQIIQGASLIADVTYDIQEGDRLTNKIPTLSLNRLLMENAELVNAPRISPPREKTGSSDFSNIMYQLPGSCIRVAMVPPGTSSHSLEFLNAGKSEEAHQAVLIAAKVLCGTAYDLIEQPERLAEIQQEFQKNQATHS